MTSENETPKVDIIGHQFLKEIFNQKEDLVQSVVINQAVEVLKRKVYERFNMDIFNLVVNRSSMYHLNKARKNIYEMSEEEVRALFNTCLIHSIASFGACYLIGGEPLVLV